MSLKRRYEIILSITLGQTSYKHISYEKSHREYAKHGIIIQLQSNKLSQNVISET